MPNSTKSFAISDFDPDAPTGSGFWHWLVYDIKPNVTSIKAGANQFGIDAKNGYGLNSYLGACPPKGGAKHHCIFTVYALDIDKLTIPKDATSAVIRFIMYKHIMAKSSIIGYANPPQ